MLGQRRRRWANIVPTLAERLVFAGYDYQHYQQIFMTLFLTALSTNFNDILFTFEALLKPYIFIWGGGGI